MTAGTDPDGWGVLEPQHVVIALHWLSVAVLWWLGVACSPLAGRAVAAAVYYPLATAIAALATAQLVRRYTHDESWHELGWLGDLRSGQLRRMLSVQACLLAVLAVLFTKGAVEPATVLTLILASLTLGLVALASGWDAAAFTGSLAWTSAWGVAGLVVADRWGWRADEARMTLAAVGGSRLPSRSGPWPAGCGATERSTNAGSAAIPDRLPRQRRDWPGRWRSPRSRRRYSPPRWS